MEQDDKKTIKYNKNIGSLQGFDPHFDQMKEKMERLEQQNIQLKKDLISA